MRLEKEQVKNLERIFRLNLINSISGIKPANLVGTRSKDGQDNVAIFSSVVHIGSNPALIGFVMRPQQEPVSDTYMNIKDTGFYTINHVAEDFIQKAHYTSVKFPKAVSEFERLNISKEFDANFHAPFVKASEIKIGLKLHSEIPLPNDCVFIIGSVELILMPDHLIDDSGQIDLASSRGVGISGLNNYYGLSKLDRFPYARIYEVPDFEKE